MADCDNTRRKRILGYSDPLTVRAGGTVEIKVSSQGGVGYEAQLVRLINGDVHSDQARFKEVEIDSPVNGTYPGREQRSVPGSCIVVDGLSRVELRECTIALHFMPTTPAGGNQTLISRWDEARKVGWSLHINAQAQLAFSITDDQGVTSSVALDGALSRGVWYAGVARVSWRKSEISLGCRPLVTTACCEQTKLENIEGKYPETRCPLVMAHNFNGRLEDPVLYGRWVSDEEWRELLRAQRSPALRRAVIADWDFSQRIESTTIVDRSSHRHDGYTRNLPLRGVKGSRWTGSTMEWRSAPDQYAAIHFHRDDLYDCGWLTDIRFEVPQGIASGIYALRLRRDGHGSASPELDEEYVPFFIAPSQRQSRADLVFVVPTYTYLAYGNFRAAEIARRELGAAIDDFYAATILGPGTKEYALLVARHPELGSSLYDAHEDGSPVHFSSWLRPLLSMRPKSVLWTLCADLLIIDWLESKGFRYDVITDDLLQAEGADLLQGYRVCITGNHPEYQTTRQLDAVASYTAAGGRLMYLGGNGYYWRVGVNESLPGVIEVRRGRVGTAVWQSEVGEGCLALSGEVGGIWRELGRPPQRLVGVGFIAQGLGAAPYRVVPGARQSSAAFALAGVEGDVIGNFGVFGAAAGQEIDRTDPAHGTPDNTVVLARSQHGPEMVYAIEAMSHVDPQIERYRHLTGAEVTLFETPSGGGVFAAGSMAWCGSLGHNGFDNNVSRITENVLRKFLIQRVP